MSTGALTPTPFQTVVDPNGAPYSGCLIYTYLAGTTTPATTYTDSALSVANANPIVADSAGRFVAYLSLTVSYKFTYKTSAGVAIREQDNISPAPAAQTVNDAAGSPVITFQNNGVTKGYVGVEAAAAYIVGGTANGLFLQSQGVAIEMSANSGSTKHFAMNSAGQLSLTGVLAVGGPGTNSGAATGDLIVNRGADKAAAIYFGSGNGTAYIVSDGTTMFLHGLNWSVDTPSNFQVGGSAARSGTAGTCKVDIFDGTAPTGTLANGCSFYSTTGEMRVMDAAGNATLLSPHDKTTNEWIFDSTQTASGKHLRIDVERMLRDLDKMLGGGYVHEDGGA